MRKICYVSGTRADFGLMRSTLLKLDCSDVISLVVVATGMHLDENFGLTVNEIYDSGLNCVRVESDLEDGSRVQMSKALGLQVIGFTNTFAEIEPDLVLLLGDRGEMLAAAIAALHLNIIVAHIHGGEQSGTIDESIRHAISKLSHYHFTTTENAKQRLIKMGEYPKNIYVTGAPGLDDVLGAEIPSRIELFEKLKCSGLLSVENNEPLITFLFHPVVQDAEEAGNQVTTILKGLPSNCHLVILLPNADAGGHLIRREIQNFLMSNSFPHVALITHLERSYYLSLLKHTDALVGNSSSGIIEAASFNIEVVNIGDRQAFRERNANVCDVDVDTEQVKQAINEALARKGKIYSNVYGTGGAGRKITELLESLPLDKSILKKANSY